ncbi:MAG: aminotransferase class I/II-fold pyridoxal phosphate-dependent enzyme, partial [Polynucleobacter victoriensis]
PQHDASKIATSLRDKHIIVRHFKLPRIDQHLRITIGTDEQCATLVSNLRALLQ